MDQQLVQVDAAVEYYRQLLADLDAISDLVPPEYRLLVVEQARAHGLDSRTLAAVGWVESRWQADASGSSGEIGIMQIMPGTAQWIAQEMGLEEYDLSDPATNVAMGAWYLRALIAERGSVEMAWADYNGGPNALERKPLAARSYIDRVRTAVESGP